MAFFLDSTVALKGNALPDHDPKQMDAKKTNPADGKGKESETEMEQE